MLRHFRFLICLLAVSAPLAVALPAEPTSKVTLETSETLFSVMTAANACDYDQEVARSEPLRAQVRAEVDQRVRNSETARAALEQLCAFYRDHQREGGARNLAQYVSLALNLGPPPQFKPLGLEADLPPEAAYVLGLRPLLEHFYAAAGLDRLWQAHRAQYQALVDQLSPDLQRMLLATDAYLRAPISGYSGRQLRVFLEPMISPGQVNSRSYTRQYFMVLSPEKGAVRMESIRHAYLHFTLDPMMANRGTSLQRVEPLLELVASAPLKPDFKDDMALLTTESLIRAIEARLAVTGTDKAANRRRSELALKAAEEGFILTPYFDEQLAEFEKGDEGLAPAFADWLHGIDVERERKRAAGIVFEASAPAGTHAGMQLRQSSSLEEAERRLAAGDLAGARDLAQESLKEELKDANQDTGRALFILAQVAVQRRDIESAQAYFERTIQATHDQRLLAWSHVYLGRILDLKAERQQALDHYRKALAGGEVNPALRAAAEQGIARPYAPPGAERPATEDPAAKDPAIRNPEAEGKNAEVRNEDEPQH